MSSQTDLGGLRLAEVAAEGGPAVRPPGRRRRFAGGDRRSRRLLAGLGLGLLIAAVVVVLSTPLGPGDSAADLLASAWAASGVASLRWQLLPVLAALTILHYVFSAVALRAVTGHPLDLREAMFVQFVASAANRLTPVGAGGWAVNTRYLARRGMPAAGALGSLAVLQVLGAVADLLLFALVLLVVRSAGTTATPVTAIGSQIAHAVGAVSSLSSAPGAVAAAVAAVLVLAAGVLLARRRTAAAGRVPCFVIRTLTAMADIRRRPRDLCTLLPASAGTTLTLGIAFAVSVAAVPGGASPERAGELVAVYLVGAAAGGAVPVPAGIGSTETALVAALLVAQVPAAPAVQAVVLFRAVTFWAPVPIGTVAARALRRRGAL